MVRMLSRTMVPVLVAVCTALLPSAVAATTLKAFTLSELAARSDAVVRVRVVHTQALWRGNIIYTLTSVRVLQVFKGLPGPEVVVVQLGGVVGDHAMPVAGTVDMDVGEELVLFLRASGHGEYVVAGMSQGAMRVAPDGAVVWAPTAPLWRNGKISPPTVQVLGIQDVVSVLAGAP